MDTKSQINLNSIFIILKKNWIVIQENLKTIQIETKEFNPGQTQNPKNFLQIYAWTMSTWFSKGYVSNLEIHTKYNYKF